MMTHFLAAIVLTPGGSSTVSGETGRKQWPEAKLYDIVQNYKYYLFTYLLTSLRTYLHAHIFPYSLKQNPS